MLKIDLQNIQAIGDAHIIIEDNTIVEFVGDNSNGKSVISKVIQALTSGDIAHEDVRRTLIKDYTEMGVAILTHNKEQLGVILKEKAKDSMVVYMRDCNKKDNTIVRAINDVEGVKALVRQFGFRVYADGDICLQLHPTWGAIPFITTSGAVNDAIVQDITVDRIAENFLKSFQTITFPVFKDKIDRLEREKKHAQDMLQALEAYDWHAYEDISNKLSEIYQTVKDYIYTELEDIPIPDLSVLDVNPLTVEDIPIVDFLDICPRITEIGDELTDYVDIMNGVCPTCGRPLITHEH